MKSALLIFQLFVAVFARPGFGPTDQEWGFAPVRDNADLFWWLHYTTANVTKPTDRPLIIFLQGGPGTSSAGYGNFAEVGPLDLSLKPRESTWVKDANVLFVDNPVGTGFSNVNSNSDLAKTNRQIAEDFLEFLKQFYDTLPEFKKVPLYIFCESYGGKMTAEIALLIDEAARRGEIDSNLKGIGLGDGWISSTDSILTWASYLLNLGQIDEKGYGELMSVANKAKQALDKKKYSESTDYFLQSERVIDDIANVYYYNVLTRMNIMWLPPNTSKLQKKEVRDTEYNIDDLMNGPVREALNISGTWDSGYVFTSLMGDFMKPVTSIVEELLNNTDISVAVYNGQLDVLVDTPGTVNWVENLRWKHKSLWNSATRVGFENDGYYQGYVKKYGKFALYWVERAGHMVTMDNPSAMAYILRDLTNNFEV